MGADAMKSCPKCESEKPVSEFHRSNQTKDGRYGICKKCKLAISNSWRARNRDKAAASTRRAKERNPDIFRERKRLWLLNNPEAARLQGQNWRAKNSEKVRTANEKWQRENRPKYRLCVRRALQKRRALGRIPKEIFGTLLSLQRRKCIVCRDPLLKFHLDHIMPVARGGTNDRHNLQLLCPDCNQHKSARHPIDFMQSRGFLL